MAAGATGILDDSSLMVENTSADSSYLRLGIGWLLEFCPEDFNISYSEGGVSFVQKGDSLYLYFPGGIGQDTYADPGYFSLGVTLGEVIDEIRVPGTPGYYVPGTDDWVFPIHMVESTADIYMEMKTVKELPDGRTEVETVINGCNVTVVFAKEDNLETMKNITDLIMSAYAERKAREAQG